EDGSYVFLSGDFKATDVDAGDSLQAVRITTVPAKGALLLDGVAVTAGQEISAADIAAGKLVFKPAADENGTAYAKFDFAVITGVAGQAATIGADATPNTFTIDVKPVSDSPAGSNDQATT
ncbi:hypothetical protein, partial [Aquabacterium lacunae]|uniref:hypothetical protein n=1 Tax=Aquabacterium lacunae TaxID=2528630 RepID=UPI0013EF4073